MWRANHLLPAPARHGGLGVRLEAAKHAMGTPALVWLWSGGRPPLSSLRPRLNRAAVPSTLLSPAGRPIYYSICEIGRVVPSQAVLDVRKETYNNTRMGVPFLIPLALPHTRPHGGPSVGAVKPSDPTLQVRLSQAN